MEGMGKVVVEVCVWLLLSDHLTGKSKEDNRKPCSGPYPFYCYCTSQKLKIFVKSGS
jgi:hypothetical protein